MSTLLEQASLVLIPSGYKEDVVYSQIPTSGSGDLSFTRASNGTRVNSAGLVEVCPWNLLQQSETFDDSVWTKSLCTITANVTTAPNGTTTADKLIETTANGYHQIYQTPINPVYGQSYTFSFYAKAAERTKIYALNQIANVYAVTFDLSNGTYVVETGTPTSVAIESVGNGWYRCSLSGVSTSSSIVYNNIALSNGSVPTYTGDGTSGAFIWGAQLNIGSTAKPYFPTTDRLNVPRLTYQNGGGGCPSLLLEKQSTNLVSYSQDFSNAYWSKLGQGIAATAVLTANYAISPDGTQNATRFVCNLNGGTSSSDRSWMVASFTAPATSTISIWIKLNSAGTKTFVFSDSGGDTKTISGTEWQRIDGTFVGAGGEFRIGLIGGTGSSDTLDCCIWGAQAEASSYPTSYIPTTSSSATRVADDCYKTGISSLIGQTSGTMFAQFSGQNCPLNNWFQITDGSSANWVFIGVDVGRVRAFIRLGGATIYSDTSYVLTDNVPVKVALAYESGNNAFYINGTQIAAFASTFTVSASISQVRFGDLLNPPNDSAQYQQAILFPTRLSNSELASLTSL